MKPVFLFPALAAAPLLAMAIDLAPLWNFSQPAVSEQRFNDALKTATGDDVLILKTQVARTWGLRKDFARAQALLAEIAPQVGTAGPEAQVRYQLELGRTFSSATHAPASQTPEARAAAREAYQRAIDIGRRAKLDALVVDAYHMLAFVDTAPADQLAWGRQALAFAQASTQPKALGWQASLRNNIGYALHQLGRDDEALAELRLALALREQGDNAEATRIAHWMVAMVLRSLGRVDEALPIQLRLEQEYAAAGRPDEYVFEELETLYRAKGDAAKAAHYAQRKAALAAR